MEQIKKDNGTRFNTVYKRSHLKKIIFPIGKNWARTNSIHNERFHVLDVGFNDFSTLKGYYQHYKTSHSTLHFVLDGHGFLELSGRRYELSAGDCFYIPGNEDKCYAPKEAAPWKYCFFTLEGNAVDEFFRNIGFSLTKPVQHIERNAQSIADTFAELIQTLYSSNDAASLFMMSALYKIAAYIRRETQSPIPHDANAKHQLASQIKKCIESNYFDPNFNVGTICQMMFYSHSYLFQVFYSVNHISLKEYLLQVRLQKAAQLLEQTTLPVKAISESVGYVDYIHFTKIFTKKYGIHPTAYRKKNSVKNL